MHRRRQTILHSAGWRLLVVVMFLLVSGLISATLVRSAPGFGVDERELDSRLSNESIIVIRDAHQDERNVFRFYAKYLGGCLHGDFGASKLFQKPISQLIEDRWGTTAENIGGGLAMAWAVVLASAFIAVTLQQELLDAALSAIGGALLSIPAAVAALLVAIARNPASCAIAIAVLPLLYRYTRNILQDSWNQPWVTAASAKGLGRVRILCSHVLPVAAPQLIALGGVSLTLAFSSSVPIEVLSDSPGLGQLAWQAATGRDLTLVVTITGLVASVVLLANAGASLASEILEPAQA
jgi:peptide/nickel transport system permease protein